MVICGAGAVGGAIHALLSDNGFALPSLADEEGVRIYPDYLGNVIIGAVAAGTSWGLYGSLATLVILGTPTEGSPDPTLTMSALAGAVLVGVGGARWLTNEVDKKLLSAAAANAASRTPNASKAAEIALASPMGALGIARSL